MLALYKNIKKRRLELKMSQDQLAAMTGYKDRSSITKIEKGEVDLAESKIREFAKALKISSASGKILRVSYSCFTVLYSLR